MIEFVNVISQISCQKYSIVYFCWCFHDCQIYVALLESQPTNMCIVSEKICYRFVIWCPGNLGKIPGKVLEFFFGLTV